MVTAKEDVIRQKKKNFEGKLFIQFVALMYLSYIKRQMDEYGLFKNFTMQTLLDELDIIEQYQQPGHESHISELTKKQVALYMAMDVGLQDLIMPAVSAMTPIAAKKQRPKAVPGSCWEKFGKAGRNFLFS